MQLWRVEVFDNETETTVRIGYVNASSQDEAARIVEMAMGSGTLTEVKLVTSAVSTLPALRVLWMQTVD